MSEESPSTGPLDVPTLEGIARRSATHPLVDGWAFEPDGVSPRRLTIGIDDDQYPAFVAAVRLDVRWYEDGSYTFHYRERRGEEVWQCRWDRHWKPDAPTPHFHPPPNASDVVEPSTLGATHPLGVTFEVLDWIEGRVGRLYEG